MDARNGRNEVVKKHGDDLGRFRCFAARICPPYFLKSEGMGLGLGSHRQSQV